MIVMQIHVRFSIALFQYMIVMDVHFCFFIALFQYMIVMDVHFNFFIALFQYMIVMDVNFSFSIALFQYMIIRKLHFSLFIALFCCVGRHGVTLQHYIGWCWGTWWCPHGGVTADRRGTKVAVIISCYVFIRCWSVCPERPVCMRK